MTDSASAAPRVTVVGMDGRRLSDDSRWALGECRIIAGAARHLDAVADLVAPGAELLTLGGLAPALDRIAAATAPAAVLASGDPGFFGIVRALRERGLDPDVHPAVSSVAAAFARVGLPWDDAVVLSAHGRAASGRSVRRALAAALAHPKAAVLTAPGTAGPEAFVGPLLRAGRTVHVAQRLAAPDESVVEAGPADADRTDWAHPNVVLAVDPDRAVAPAMAWMPGHQGAPDGWALPEDAFEHRASMVTKPEVRAFALARLAPRPGTVVWDVGACSGSVAVECARFGAHAIAFEQNAEDCARIRANALAHGVHVDVREGRLPEAFPEPDTPGATGITGTTGAGGALAPDAVFLGGGDDRVAAEAVHRFRPERVVVALASVDRVAGVHALLTGAGYRVEGTQLQASRLAPLPNGSLRLAAANPVTLVCGTAAPGGT
ncbi:precorrin-6y C5,15-methyltransferase (decarboxylating) subunit CbiE [Nocardiopsis sp. RSe5-2]|uniref:Precorrin-6y C5,15-methyltransferase (Decarboxylating) subunit CbiE n=1 Tax=Nocardiopsis endophytica TaxID=3018445 RepID=A0ABT4UBF6_9ACTN|nr:precorrin-6y C5,15-methyltransferase (decarboxylating) subunit CbiE [Nocardiopsis endophytica]MDA2814071.1 precorrin-6y C5,15-methyltransferase (decarboxylating) subunit CbiE [Nocardiopsis endophytica]